MTLLVVEDEDPKAEAWSSASCCSTTDQVDWPELVERIRRGEETGVEDLYRIFAKGDYPLSKWLRVDVHQNRCRCQEARPTNALIHVSHQ